MTPDEFAALPGWYDYADVHRLMVDAAPPGSTLVEVGVYHGKSLIGLCRLAAAADKGLRVVGVDHFRGSAEHAQEVADGGFDHLLHCCRRNLRRAGVGPLLVVGESTAAAGLFADRTLGGVFVDGSHDEPSVAADIAAWGRTVRAGGLLAGHDFKDPAWPGVAAAVRAVFGDTPGAVRRVGPCWVVNPDR